MLLLLLFFLHHVYQSVQMTWALRATDYRRKMNIFTHLRKKKWESNCMQTYKQKSESEKAKEEEKANKVRQISNRHARILARAYTLQMNTCQNWSTFATYCVRCAHNLLRAMDYAIGHVDFTYYVLDKLIQFSIVRSLKCVCVYVCIDCVCMFT